MRPRDAWSLVHGGVPRGLCVLHRCDVPACVNPDHLWLGTVADNNADKKMKGRAAIGARHGTHTKPWSRTFGSRNGSVTKPERVLRGEARPNARLSDASVRDARDRRAKGATFREIGAALGVSETAIRKIVHGQTWAHI